MSWPVYGTLTEHNAYWAAHGTTAEKATWDAATDTAKVDAGRLASEYLDETYQWKGRKLDKTQVRSWPRSGAYDADSFSISGIPQTLKDATSYLMLRVLQGETLSPDVASGELEGSVLRRKSRVGDLEEEVEFSGGASLTTHKRFPKVSKMLRAAGLVEPRGRLERG